MDINDIIDSIYKLPDASKEALLSDAPEVAYPKGFHLFRANHKNSKFYLRIVSSYEDSICGRNKCPPNPSALLSLYRNIL